MCQKFMGFISHVHRVKKKVNRKCSIRGGPLKENRQKQNKKTTTLNMIVHDQWSQSLNTLYCQNTSDESFKMDRTEFWLKILKAIHLPCKVRGEIPCFQLLPLQWQHRPSLLWSTPCWPSPCQQDMPTEIDPAERRDRQSATLNISYKSLDISFFLLHYISRYRNTTAEPMKLILSFNFIYF